MSLDDIQFNPYNQVDINEGIKAFEKRINSSSMETSIEELALKVYFDSSYNWKELIRALFEKFNLNGIIVNHFNHLITEKQIEILSPYTYLVTFLISNNILSLGDLDDIKVKNLFTVDPTDSKFILLSFLATWDLDKAIKIDPAYVDANFRHLVEARKAPITKLIKHSNDEVYYNILKGMLTDNKVQFHTNQAIQKIIINNNPEEIKGLEFLINKCLESSSVTELEFILDGLELSSLRKFLLDKWSLKLTEKLYNNFAQIKSIMNSAQKKRAISIINRIKDNNSPNLLLAARHEINQLHIEDKDFITNTVNEINFGKIEDFSKPNITFENANDSWEWVDYAHYIRSSYGKIHPEDSSIDLEKLYQELNLKLIIHKFETAEFDACLVRDSTLISPIIFVNSNKKSNGRINFSIAHELAHAVIPEHSNKSFFCFVDDVREDNKIVMDKKVEEEANSFASEMLLPKVEFKETISKLNFNSNIVMELSQRFGASYVLVARRWAELSTLEIAMVVSTNGIVDWAKRSDTFPYVWIDTIPKDSTVYDVMRQNDKISKAKKSYTTKWVDTPFEKPILEESIRIYKNKVLTLLQIIEN